MRNPLFTAAVILFLSLCSCGKYEDGPVFSFHSKEHRLVATWYVDHETEDGVDKTSDFANLYQGYTLTIAREGTYAITYAFNGIFNYSETGTWEWDSRKEHVLLTKTSSNSVTDWEILELKEKELKVRYTDYSSNPNKTIEITFIALN